MLDENCGYCVGGAPLAKFGIKICDLDVSQLILSVKSWISVRKKETAFLRM